MTNETYDSTNDTLDHIWRIQELMYEVCDALEGRAEVHDETKLKTPEKPIFDQFTPRLRDSVYGSEEYQGFLDDMQEALQHHYSVCRHHPEHFENGIEDMNFLDLIEMLADWKAAGERHADGGDLKRSIEINANRFGYDDVMIHRLTSTASQLGWL